jgi:hypothetical protein
MTNQQKRQEDILKLCVEFMDGYKKIESLYEDGNQLSTNTNPEPDKTEKELKTFNCYTRLIQKKDGTTFTKLTTKYEGKYCDVLIGKDVVAPDTTKSWTIKTDDFKFLNGEYGKIWINNILEYSELEEN